MSKLLKIYYTVNSTEAGEEAEANTLIELYKIYKDLKEGDAGYGIKRDYYFVRHEIIDTGKPYKTDRQVEGNLYKRGGKVYFKPIQ